MSDKFSSKKNAKELKCKNNDLIINYQYSET